MSKFLRMLLIVAMVKTVHAAEVEFLVDSVVAARGFPFSPAVRVGDTYYLSGQVGTVPGEVELVSGGIEAETRQALTNIRSILEENRLTMKNVVKCTVMLEDISEWAQFNAVYDSFFTPPYPVRSAFGTDGLALGARVEVECMAVRSLRGR